MLRVRVGARVGSIVGVTVGTRVGARVVATMGGRVVLALELGLGYGWS